MSKNYTPDFSTYVDTEVNIDKYDILEYVKMAF